eukprot:3816378-Prymnesium_polylepis.2
MHDCRVPPSGKRRTAKLLAPDETTFNFDRNNLGTQIQAAGASLARLETTPTSQSCALRMAYEHSNRAARDGISPPHGSARCDSLVPAHASRHAIWQYLAVKNLWALMMTMRTACAQARRLRAGRSSTSLSLMRGAPTPGARGARRTSLRHATSGIAPVCRCNGRSGTHTRDAARS